VFSLWLDQWIEIVVLGTSTCELDTCRHVEFLYLKCNFYFEVLHALRAVFWIPVFRPTTTYTVAGSQLQHGGRWTFHTIHSLFLPSNNMHSVGGK